MKYFYSCWEELKDRLAANKILLLLDYDGTLTPIAKTPAMAVLPRKTKRILTGLCNTDDCKVAIVSGRSLEDIKEKVGVKYLTYAGNHGLEIGNEAETPYVYFMPLAQKQILDMVYAELLRRLYPFKGVLVENKGFTLSVHYRLAMHKYIPIVKRIVKETCSAYQRKRDIKVAKGKKVLEIKPFIDWDKGKAALWLWQRMKVSYPKENILPVYIGDDKTDEDAFSALREDGLTLRVGYSSSSRALYYIKSIGEVIRLLQEILELKKTKENRNGKC